MSEKNSSKKGKCRKVLGWILTTLCVIIVALLVVVSIVINRIDPIVKYGLEEYGPKLLGAPVTVQKVDFSLLKMRFELKDLVVGNPEGYNTDNAISVGRVFVKVRVKSLFTKMIEVNQILVEAPEITYEVGLGNSNIGTLLENVEKATASDKEEEEKPEEEVDDGDGRKVVIDEVKVSDGKIRLSAKILQGLAAPVPLPTITLHDIGKEKDGASFVEATGEMLKGIFTGVIDCGKSALSAIGDGAKKVGEAIGDGAKKVGEAIGDGASKAVDSLKNIFGGDKK